MDVVGDNEEISSGRVAGLQGIGEIVLCILDQFRGGVIVIYSPSALQWV
jgi:hypothetical protein